MSLKEVSVHPHACGENGWNGSSLASTNGPPPRVWGKLKLLLSLSTYHRSTPTRVGKTSSSRACKSATAVHPHACGEN